MERLGAPGAVVVPDELVPSLGFEVPPTYIWCT